jgi:integrase
VPKLTNALLAGNTPWKTRKITDPDCEGLYASQNRGGVSFGYKFTDRGGRQRSIKIGNFHPETFTVHAARRAVHELKGRIASGENVIETATAARTAAVAQAVTVDDLIKKRIEWMRTLEPKSDGEMRPRIETWSNTASHLRRFLGEHVGHRPIGTITRHDIIAIHNAIEASGNVSNLRHFRRAVTGFFNWAVEHGHLDNSPCTILPKLRGEPSRERALSPDEIRTFWRGLDRDDLPTGHKAVLAMRFALATMLRSGELLPLHRSEIFLDAEIPYVLIPAKRVKKRRDIKQPLSPLAVSILKEVLADGDDYVFQSARRSAKSPISRSIMANALRGRPDKGAGKGICELLGLAAFTPHDLRRTAATLAGKLRFSDSWIEACLDHQKKKEVSKYNRDDKFEIKYEVLCAVGKRLQEIIKPELRLAA